MGPLWEGLPEQKLCDGAWERLQSHHDEGRVDEGNIQVIGVVSSADDGACIALRLLDPAAYCKLASSSKKDETTWKPDMTYSIAPHILPG